MALRIWGARVAHSIWSLTPPGLKDGSAGQGQNRAMRGQNPHFSNQREGKAKVGFGL